MTTRTVRATVPTIEEIRRANWVFYSEFYAKCGYTPEQIAELESENTRVTQLDTDKEVGEPLLIDFVFDASGSMGAFYDVMAEEFNGTMLGGLRGVNRRQAKILRLGGLVFGTGRSHIWPGFRSLRELGTAPLSAEMFRRPEVGNQTALYSAMICAMLWADRCRRQFSREVGKTSRSIVIVLTDGANNEQPLEPQRVQELVDKVGNLVTPFLVYFKTNEGLSEAGSKELAEATGFNHMGYYDITSRTGDKQERRRKFRHAFGLFSSAVAGAATRKVA